MAPGYPTPPPPHPIPGLVFGILWRGNNALPKKKPDGLEEGGDDSAELLFMNQLDNDDCMSAKVFGVFPMSEGG